MRNADRVAYPEELLASDEKVVRHLHPHWITLVGPVLVLVVVAALAGVGIAFVPDGDAQMWLQLAILLVAVVLVFVFFLIPLLRWLTTHYVITTHRVMFRIGILNRQGKDVSLRRITDVAYTQSLWDRIVNSGTLTIESAGEGTALDLSNIPHSDRIQQLINRLVEDNEVQRTRPAPPPPGSASPYPPDTGREQTRRYDA